MSKVARMPEVMLMPTEEDGYTSFADLDALKRRLGLVLDCMHVSWQRNIYNQATEIAWLHEEPESRGSISGVPCCSWKEFVGVVRWPDPVLELLRSFSTRARALRVILSCRTQVQVNLLGAKLQQATRPEEEEGSDECDECDGSGYYTITPDGGEPVRHKCICSEPQVDA